MKPAILWLRRDLRLDDHPALIAALRHGSVLPVYVRAPESAGRWAEGGASRWWLHHSLAALGARLRAKGSRLIILKGRAAEALSGLARKTGVEAVYFSRLVDPWARKEEEAVLALPGIHAEGFAGGLLYEPGEIMSLAGHPFRVFTPFWKSAQQRAPALPVAEPGRIPTPAFSGGLALDELELLPKIGWATEFSGTWTPGEEGARRRLGRFLGGVADYDRTRDLPFLDGTSGLSAHLHFGELSPRRAYFEVFRAPVSSGREAFLRELGWREFAHHALFHFPRLPEAPMDARFDGFPWRRDPSGLEAWRKGTTGFPIVDAGMRQLWRTGWMHNRVRMAAASFLTKDLLIDWREGARWFWDTLADADLANNTLGWQWASGCGPDAAPFFRVFNPTLQGEKFDPDGEYVRRWVPELAQAPARWIHKPWEMPDPPKAYPKPIVDHAAARLRALAAFKEA